MGRVFSNSPLAITGPSSPAPAMPRARVTCYAISSGREDKR
jgi:hypothetical protein